jgi:hypothetical protein
MPRGVSAAVLAAGAIAFTGCGDNNGGGPSGPAAMSGYEIVSGNTASIGTTSQTTVTASCPMGKAATGGGYTTMDEAANVYDNFPVSDGSGWTVSAKNENLISTGAGSIVVTPFAICVNRPAGYEVRSGSITLGHQHAGDGEARCQDATFALLGGGVSTGDPQVHPFTTAPGSQSQPTWVSAFKSNYSIALPSSSSATTTAICAGLPEAPGRTEVTSASTALGPKSKGTLSVNCPSGTKALSGGLTSGESPAIWFDSSPASGGTGWTASIHNPQSPLESVTLHVTITAVCAKTD